jgi:nucleotide-binding universal stress UspA family protein
MKTFNNIVIATDFSQSSTNAYTYAKHLATQHNATLTVVHVYDIPIDPSTLDYLAVVPSPTDLEKAVNEQMTRFVNEADKGDNTLVDNSLRMKIKILMGLPADTLIDHSQNPLADLLILGTVGAHDWVDKLFGSVAVKVMTDAHCPVLLVPQKAVYKGIHQALYATSPNASSDKDVSLAIDCAHFFAAPLHFVHVKGVFEDPDDDGHALFQRVLAQKAVYYPYSIENVDAPTVAEGINYYCLTHPIDLIIAITHHRSFWSDLIHYSTTKELAWHALTPILCLHSDEEIIN